MTQNQALIRIKANLKTIDSINHFLNLHSTDGFVSYTFDGNILKMPIEKSTADTYVGNFRKDLISETTRLAKTNSIELDGKDKDILNRKESVTAHGSTKEYEEN